VLLWNLTAYKSTWRQYLENISLDLINMQFLISSPFTQFETFQGK
jgi:hypothetical protein